MITVSLQRPEGPVLAPGCEASVWGQSPGPHYDTRARLGDSSLPACRRPATSSAWEGGGFQDYFWDKTTYKFFQLPHLPPSSGCWEGELQTAASPPKYLTAQRSSAAGTHYKTIHLTSCQHPHSDPSRPICLTCITPCSFPVRAHPTLLHGKLQWPEQAPNSPVTALRQDSRCRTHAGLTVPALLCCAVRSVGQSCLATRGHEPEAGQRSLVPRGEPVSRPRGTWLTP